MRQHMDVEANRRVFVNDMRSSMESTMRVAACVTAGIAFVDSVVQRYLFVS